MSRTNTTAVLVAFPAGVLLQLAVQAATHMSADDVSVLSKMGVFTVTMAALGSGSVFGTKAAIERHEDTVRLRRHRRATAPRADQRPAPAVQEQPAPAAVDEAPAPDAIEEQVPAEPIVAPPMAVRPRPLDASAVDWPRPPTVDPYLMPAAVDADGFPAVPFGTAEDAAARLADRDPAVIPAHDEQPDGWEQLRAPAATRSADDLLWYAPAGPA